MRTVVVTKHAGLPSLVIAKLPRSVERLGICSVSAAVSRKAATSSARTLDLPCVHGCEQLRDQPELCGFNLGLWGHIAAAHPGTRPLLEGTQDVVEGGFYY